MRVVGIMLVKNEDLFVEAAARNVLAFCDELLFADHGSTDRTGEILRSIAAEFPTKVRYTRIASARDSHEMLRPYAGTDTWIFRVDGDEIYDQAGLARFRERLASGAYDPQWVLLGHMLNCTELDREARRARGYLSPPSRPGTSLFNFRAIIDWPGDCLERLHGGAPQFQPGYSLALRHGLHTEWSWDESPFRCLHACFLQRSSIAADKAIRSNVQEHGRWPVIARLRASVRRLLGLPVASYKKEKYRRGELVTVDAAPFFP